MPARKTSRTSSRKPRKCHLNRARTANGGCSRKVPCMGPDGGSLSYAKRGQDGHCRLRPCVGGKIRNPATGRCNSRRTKDGRMLALSKRYDDAVRFVDAYGHVAMSTDTEPPYYYRSFNPSKLQGLPNAERLRQGAQIQGRRDERVRANDAKWLAHTGERSFMDHLKRQVNNVAVGIFGDY